ESVTEGTVSQWLVEIGDSVDKYQPLLEVMTDKVNAEVPALFTGKIVKQLVEADQTVAVGTPVCQIEVESNEPGADASDLEEKVSNEPEQEKQLEASSMSKRYSPAVLTLAQEHQIDLNQVEGTGLAGRITRKDVQNHLEEMKQDV